jgi:hypothetical protein
MAPLQSFAPARNRDFISVLVLMLMAIRHDRFHPPGDRRIGDATDAIGQQPPIMLLNHDSAARLVCEQ